MAAVGTAGGGAGAAERGAPERRSPASRGAGARGRCSVATIGAGASAGGMTSGVLRVAVAVRSNSDLGDCTLCCGAAAAFFFSGNFTGVVDGTRALAAALGDDRTRDADCMAAGG